MQRILIANRGEIAVRIIHACHDDGRTAIAVYADDDADALFVNLADEAYALHGRSMQQTYLGIDAIMRAARAAKADAVHPGYGFLSENADFAQAVIDAGMIWIGPSPDAIRALGDKVQARAIAAEVGAPMAPGTTAPVQDPTEVVAFAKEYGLPLAIKAVHGGGGRGLKVVRRLDEVREAFATATHEAELAFGNGDCFIERFLDRPRHVEVQVLGDSSGKVIAVGTRDCSLQRRNQKLIEEAPAPFLDDETTMRLEDAAVAICSQVGYVGAGTVEFLVADDGTMSFMEVNTRIQVEHPVTELVSGIDLVREQLHIAEGGSLARLRPEQRGHAIECRINAEDPARGFVPFPGVISVLRSPSGPGVRFDTGIAAGSSVPDQFDSMLAKLIVHADTRAECIRRLRHALDELRIEGVPTVVPFDKAVLNEPDFVADDGRLGIYTRWIEEVFLPRTDPESLDGGTAGMRAGSEAVTRTWIELDGRRVELGLPAQLGARLNSTQSGTLTASAGGQASDAAQSSQSDHAVVSLLAGTVVRWLVEDGASVNKDDPVVVIEAMKMETQVAASRAGVLRSQAAVGDFVEFGQQLGEVL
ncbi:MAG: ATP-grasp domain-containing protein [Bifidobacterium tibiigranuli]|jgi:acetyl-CoA/propionyl-CoA carboxylase biotin carboxyl carrier protein|uniref:acetyl/propionyl/methylcrotonyl-CoA carboxylase subunit alpha n=1 Tax=Bifidobacterium tibiigranuli TaxID=2172043 RepID=UPI0023537120|nr:biotin carboxylase N-terminal domain-containing protein [Bifidobacterium tibiigranuli]MCH3974006.1 ATP-grasp domain-containing protein [Bifidobacterium tibiigranuli]MCH4189780.1 ATP-grasp domain-containing protein [Bifidobacterium tibiigranuli]MCH4203996.1 ATP-grasp domain-containing protein [Bifidobacterium tibiigranuli]MCH4274497.1 ATP-grasp domain-containing protein [Bifidobacterium tibiigranuli]MCI1790826.1 ATP-grasp domain-containing protein [Bifidobacterium tibiigranuli]